MPLKLNKTKINLTSKQKSSFSPTAGKMLSALRQFEDSAPKTAEGEIAFTDEDTNARYLRLQKKGLNILRSEIIAISEFIPVAVGDDKKPNTNKINYNLGDNKQVSVTNVARLIELHRQIREYVINAAVVALRQMYPSPAAPGFLKELKDIVQKNFDRCVDENIDKTVENIMKAVKETGSPLTKRRVRSNETSPFFIATVEYFVYENLVEEIVRYLGSVAQIDDKFKKFWSIEKFHNFKSFTSSFSFSEVNSAYSDSSTFLDDGAKLPISLLTMFRTGANSDTDMFLNAVSHLASLILLKDSASVLISSEDIDNGSLEIEPGVVRYGTSGDLADAIDSLKDITLSGMLCGFGSGTSKDRAAVNANVSANLVKVSDAKLHSIFTSIEDANGESINDVSEGINELMVAMSYDFVTAACGLNGVASKLSPLGNSLNIGGLPPSSLTLLTYVANVLGCEKEQLDTDGDLEVSRDGLPVLPSNLNIDSDEIRGNPGVGFFSYPLVGIREFNQDDRDVFYAPIEATGKEALASGQGYIPATQFFIETAIERSGQNIEFEDLNNFVDEYENRAKNLQKDILTLIPDSKIVESGKGVKKPFSFLGKNSARSHLEYINRVIAADLDDIIEYNTDSEKTLFPQLAIFIRDQSGDAKIRNFQAAFWGLVYRHSQENRNDRVGQSVVAGLFGGGSGGAAIGAGIGFLAGGPGGAILGAQIGASVGAAVGAIAGGVAEGGRDASVFRKLIIEEKDRDEEAIIKRLQVFLEFYLETAIIDFIENTCNITIKKKSNQKFIDSNTSYKTFIRGIHYLRAKHVAPALGADTPLNSEASDIPRGSTTKLSIAHGDVDNVFGKSFGDQGKYLNDLVGAGNFNNGKYNACPGFYRMFRRTLGNVVFSRNVDIEAALGKAHDEPLYSETSTINAMFVDGKINEKPGAISGVVGLAAHHRALITLSYIHNLLRKTVQVYARTNDEGYLELKVDLDHIRGLRHALLGSPRDAVGGGDSKKAAYDAAKKIIDDLFEKYDAREERIRDCASLFSAHAAGYREAQKKANEIVKGDSKQSQLAINAMKEMGVFKDALTLNNDEAPALITHSFQKNYLTDPGSLFPRDIYFNGKKNSFMFKFLSQKGYGFLEEEKRGNKSLLHVGIPNSMLSALQINAFEETDDINYLYSPYVCISVFKKSHLYPEYNFYPKNYIFDTSANILDYNPKNGELSNHLKNYKGNSSFDQLLKSVDISRFSVDENGNTKTVVSRGYGKNGVYDRDVLINHVTDYVMKEYCKLTTGLDFDEDSFLLSEQPIDFDIITPTNFLGSRLDDEYVKILDMLQNIYPEAENDDQLRSEVFRLTKIIKQAAPFSFSNRFKKAVTPKSFDRVYTLLVNEKDFILNSAENIFTEPVEFHINSRIQRPEKLNSLYENLVNLRSNSSNVIRQDSEIVKYAKSINENYPEVYNYSVSISLLPLSFETGANLKPPHKQDDPAPSLESLRLEKIASRNAVKKSMGLSSFANNILRR